MFERLQIRPGDAFLALLVLVVALLLLIPLPTFVLDLLLAANITFALLLLLIGLYMPNALALLSFPTVLLLTTLFRLSLNVASTRLILSQGDAGLVIQAFGTFLIGDVVEVGVIIFVIITLVNFIVIARGASRVSEVAARFALDALPGKQMAIDADLRQGTINAHEAQERRDDLRKESQLYGAMDGAMKFVQGDVVAGFFIIVTNILGGVYLAVKSGMSMSEAVNRYTVLTVGDGLVTQIPALLISICAGIVVTRVSSGDNITLGADLGAQLFRKPELLLVAGGLALGVGIVAQLPLWPFLLVAAGLTTLAFRVRKLDSSSSVWRHWKGEFEDTSMLLPSPVKALEESSVSLELQVDRQMLGPWLERFRDRNEQRWADWRQEFYEQSGLPLPSLKWVVVRDLKPGQFHFVLNGTRALSGSVPSGAVMIPMHPTAARVIGLPVMEEARHPLSNKLIFWAPATSEVNSLATAGEFSAIDYAEYLVLSISSYVCHHPEEVLTLAVIHNQLRELERCQPGLALEALGGGFVSTARLTEIMQLLARSGLNVWDFKAIIETIGAYCASEGQHALAEQEFSAAEVVSYVRRLRGRHLWAPVVVDRLALPAFMLRPEFEDSLENSVSGRNAIQLSPVELQRFRSSVSDLLHPLERRGVLSPVLICRGDLRRQLENLLRICQFQVVVLGYDELDPGLVVEPIALVG